VICITGTPGTGKSAVLEELGRRGHRVHEFDSISGGCVVGIERGEKVVDEDCLKNITVEEITAGHLSHYANCDIVIVLRSHLKDIYQRLREREYERKKIMENVESEAIDLIGYEAESIHPGRTVEVMNESIMDTADIIESIIAGEKFPLGKIDLMEEILDWY
jgi:adenylate kinase